MHRCKARRQERVPGTLNEMEIESWFSLLGPRAFKIGVNACYLIGKDENLTLLASDNKIIKKEVYKIPAALPIKLHSYLRKCGECDFQGLESFKELHKRGEL